MRLRGEVRRIKVNDEDKVVLIVSTGDFAPGDLINYDPVSNRFFRCKRLPLPQGSNQGEKVLAKRDRILLLLCPARF